MIRIRRFKRQIGQATQCRSLARLISGVVMITLGMAVCGVPHAQAASADQYFFRDPATYNVNRPFGLGVIFGEPTGLTGKYWMDRLSAIDAGLAFSFNDYFLIYGDYLYHFPGAFGHSSEFASQLTPYLGAGLMLLVQTTDTGAKDRTYFRSDQGSVGLAIRIPLGLEWRPQTLPVGVFAEIVPGVGLVPATYGLVQGGLGIRYYF